MTRDELVKIMNACMEYTYNIHGEQDIFHKEEAADRILAALEKEREGEVVLAEGEVGWRKFQETHLCVGTQIVTDSLLHLFGKRGQLIFRPTKEAK